MAFKKIYFEIEFSGYPKKEVWHLAHKLGNNLSCFLGAKKFKLLLDSKVLIDSWKIKFLRPVSDDSYKLHSAAKALEGFLKKIIKGQKLESENFNKIGKIFGGRHSDLSKKIKDARLIAKTKSVWDFCRNEIMHFTKKECSLDERKKYDEIIEIMKLLFEDFYGKTEPNEEINKNYKKYYLNKIRKF